MLNRSRGYLSFFQSLARRAAALGLFLLLAGSWQQAHGASIALVQHTSIDAGQVTSASLTFVSPNTGGNWIAVVIRAGNSSSQVFTLTDSNGNTYHQAFQLGITANPITMAVYYAENIKGGANTVHVSDTVQGPFRVAILEYSGVAISNSIDGTATGQGTSRSPVSGNVTTTANGDLLLGEVVTNSPATFTAGAGYTIRDSVPAEPNSKLITEDQLQASAGTASASATLAALDVWGAGLVAVKALTGVAGAPSTITATAGTPQSTTISTAFTTQLQATVKDSFNNPVSGVQVTFAAPGSGASGTFAGGTTTATTNAQGVATAAVFTANTIAGGYVVTASVSGVANPANFSLTNLAGSAAVVTATAGTPQSTAINTAFATALQATVKDSFSNLVSGVTVTFTAPGSGASGTFANGTTSTTAVTNAQGVATSSAFTANATAGGPYSVTASATGATSANFALTNTSAQPATVAVSSGSGQSATINTAFGAPLAALVTDAANNPVSGVTVTFTAPGSGASGTFANGTTSTTAITNASGVATSSTFTANATAGGPYNVTASATGATSANFALTNTVGPASKVGVSSGSGQSAAINTAFAAPLVATVVDAGNNPVSGITVTFTAPGSGASGTFTSGTATTTAITNASGVATSSAFTANATVGGPYNVVASATGATSANFSLTNTASAPTNIALVQHNGLDGGTTTSASLAFASANTAGNWIAVVIRAGGSSSQVFTVKDSNGNTYKQAYQLGVTASPITLAIYYAENIKAGANTVTVSDTVSGPLRIAAMEYSGVAISNSIDGAATGQGTSTSPLSGNVATTANGDLLLGEVVTNSPATFTAGAGYTIRDSVPAEPNSKLITEDQLQASAGTASASAMLAALDTWGAGLAAFKAAGGGGAGVPSTITSSAGTPQSATVNTAFATQLQATVKDSLNNPVSGVQVTFAAPGSGASGTFAGGTTTATTNAQGVATAAVFTANTIAGGYVVTAKVSGVANPANFSLTNLAGSAASVTATAGTPQSAAINAAFATALQATVKDSFSNPVNGVTVTFTAPGSGASGTFANGTTATTAVTNAQGVATSSTFTANATAGGPYNVTASATGATSANFALTNTSAQPATVAVSSGSGQSATINNAFAAALAALVTDAASNPISGVTVTFTAPGSGASGTFANGTTSTTAVTNASGVATSSTFTANSTAGGPYNVVASVTGATSANFALTNLAAPAPSITTLSLTQGPVGAGITINGSNFESVQGTSAVTFFNGVIATVTSWSSIAINVTVPTGATTGNVVVTVGGQASNGVTFTVTPPPNITSINPTAGPVGASVVITGSNFGNTVGTIQSYVMFGATQTRSSNWSNTSITAPVPLGASSGNVIVYVGGVPSNAVPFTVTPPPSISTVNPAQGPVGTSVTVSGANFGATQQSSTVTFNGTAGTPSSWSDGSIVVPVPSGATSGNVLVSVGGIASNSVSFSVTASTGSISLVQHTNRDAGTTTSTTVSFVSPNAAGNWIAVILRAGGSSSQTFTVSDSNANTYRQAFQVGVTASPIAFAIYYAENIKGGANTITVSDTVSGPLRVAILEYTGVAQGNSLELSATGQGAGTAPNSGNLTTTSSGDLLLGEVVTNSPATITGGAGYAIEESVPAAPNTKLIAEDQLQRTAGTASASATLAASDTWGAGLAAFRSITGAGLPLSVTVSPSSASVYTGSAQNTQNFTASLVNDFQHQGVTWALSGAGCSGSTCGTLTNVTTTSVTYNSPATVPSPATVTLTANAVADGSTKSTATITVLQGVISVSVSPKRATATLSAMQTVQFTATVFNDSQNLGVTWQVDGNNGGTAASGTITASGLFTPGTAAGVHTVMAVSNANASATASASVAVTDLAGVYMHHNDVQRTGQNLNEYALTTSTVTSPAFGALFSCPVDGYLWAAPLWVAHLTIGGQTRNVVYLATSHDSVYAFDADSTSCVQLWTVSFLSTGVTTVATADVNDTSADMFPEIGITSTPVIDPATNTIYVEAKTKDTVSSGCSSGSPCYFHHLHALDLITGAEKFGGPVLIAAANFDTRIHLQRPALLLNNGTVYVGFGSHGDHNSYQGWLFGYNASTLAQQFVTPLTASAGNKGGVWGGGAGPAADASGNVYVSTGNGSYDGTANWGDTAVKVSPTGTILDWFTPFDQATFNNNDIDLGSSGVIILPDSVGSSTHQHLALATGKVSVLYLLDQTNMGKFTCSSCSNNDVQEVTPVPPPNTTQLDGGLFGSPAYWNGNIYTTGVNFPLSQFQIANGTIATPQIAKSTNTFPLRGATPIVSASGTTNGIVWVLDLGGWKSNNPAILDAYDANGAGTPGTLTLLYSSPASGAGAAPPAVKFTIPMVANGKVYVGGEYKFTVFGLAAN